MSTVMTPETVQTVLDALKAGLGIDTAAQYAGIGQRTVKDWLAKGRAALEAADMNDAPIPIEDLHYADFSKEVDTARAQAIARNITAIQQAAARDWRAAAWWLERVHADQFAARDTRTVELTGADGGPIDMHSEHVVIGAIDVQVSLDAAAHPARVSAIAVALAQAGLFGESAAIEAHGEPADPDTDVDPDA